MNTNRAPARDVFTAPAAAPAGKLSMGTDRNNQMTPVCSVAIDSNYRAGDTVAGLTEQGNVCRVILDSVVGVEKLVRTFSCRMLND